jgi:hypothetical protein
MTSQIASGVASTHAVVYRMHTIVRQLQQIQRCGVLVVAELSSLTIDCNYLMFLQHFND